MSITCAADEEFQDDVQLRLADLGTEMVEIKATLEFIKEHIVKATTTIETVSTEAMPTINAIMESPLVKMLGMKKGK